MHTSFNLTVECEVGYYGQKCNSPCRYPSYGTLCQNNWAVAQHIKCNHIYGCENITDIKYNMQS